jgi:hypothetical protein
LENDFEEEMSLLWDMSYEPDVMAFLVQNNVFNIIRQTLDESSCARLTVSFVIDGLKVCVSKIFYNLC